MIRTKELARLLAILLLHLCYTRHNDILALAFEPAPGGGGGGGESAGSTVQLTSSQEPVPTSDSGEQRAAAAHPQQQQQQFFVTSETPAVLSGNTDNLKRYILKDYDDFMEPKNLNQDRAARWRISLNQLLESLSSSIPAPPPSAMLRSGRAPYPSSGGGGGDLLAAERTRYLQSSRPRQREQREQQLQQQQQQQQLLRQAYNRQQAVESLESAYPTRASAGQGIGQLPLFLPSSQWPASTKNLLTGIVFDYNKSSRERSTPSGGGGAGGTISNQRRSSQGSGTPAMPRHRHHSIGTDEVPIQTPMHARSASGDAEWKRVENSRWNNLRGMWGKRADGAEWFEAQEEGVPSLLSPAATDELMAQQQQIMSSGSM